jgi:secreted trypsin-like serine protease
VSISNSKGDSGGPLVIKSGNFYYLAGITSYGPANGCKGIGVYTSVVVYEEWIRQTINSTASFNDSSFSNEVFNKYRILKYNFIIFVLICYLYENSFTIAA